MIKRIILATLLAAAAPTLAQTPPAPAAPASTSVAEELVRVALETEKGRIVLALDKGRAPVTTANFLAYVDKGWLDGQPFYRALKYGEGGIIQGGVRDGARQLPPIKHESTAATGLKNVAGTIAMANAGAGTARSDFFIMTHDVPAFDAKGPDIGFAAFGRVIEGMDVVQAILASPTSPTKGEGVMRGQMLEPVVKIVKAARVK
ncbi:peptidylprolyl isomerase [Sphingomonas sp. HDW15A]|uniref:peptidylprolyl isomerase n=1 Tax=Sphingomonas sp. HDW15A TaxID=2714942 RepID=UPI00140DF049|nr:peptidylprolyl isomerase [Sphingomonas sp. HDW15A]QIK95112.1 peptidylprolyl isomerase [Sphingomonas sp. HDW15A]